MAEWWYITSYHTTIHTTPHKAMFGQPPQFHLPYFPSDSKIEAVDKSLQAQEATINLLKFHLQRAQHRMKQQADRGRLDRQLEVGD